MKILLLEDDEVFAGVLQQSLRRRGFEVQWFSCAEQVEMLTGKEAFTHAILDLKLEQGSSLPLIPGLLARWPDLQVLVLTGYASIQTAVQAVKLGAINYLCKPADTDSILAALCTPQQAMDIEPPEQPLSVGRLEWEHIQKVLADCDNNISATARALGMHRRTLQRKLSKRPLAR